MKKDQMGSKGCGYKKGGSVKRGKAKKEVKVDGKKSMPRLDKPSAFKRGGHVKKHTHVHINVGTQAPPVAPPMAPPMAGAPMPPPGAGGPPMMPPPGMKKGGAVKMTAGALSGKGRLEKTEIQKRKK